MGEAVEKREVVPYDYILPLEYIAQRPVHPADSARLLLVQKETGALSETTFSHLDELIPASSILLLNNTKVLPARLWGKFKDSDGDVELLLVTRLERDRWSVIGKPMRKFQEGTEIVFGDKLTGVIQSRTEKFAEITFTAPSGDSYQTILELGAMPIPPYIRSGRSDQQDRTDYQTLFAEVDGSIAAPTASLHFTPQLLQRLKDKGVRIRYLTLHVGTPSFLPLESNEGEIVPPGVEEYFCSESIWEEIQSAKLARAPVIAVGTTVARAIESIASTGTLQGSTNLFIAPGYHFKIVDGLVTNFHQPRTTHLSLVEALIGRSSLTDAYNFALKSSFRFLSYGDAMFIMPQAIE